MRFFRIMEIEFLYEFSSVDIGSRFPDVVGIVVMMPLDKIVNGLTYFLRVQDMLYLKYFFSINDFRFGNGVFEYRAMVR